MTKMRTIKEAAKMLQTEDNGTAVTESSVRRLVKDGKVPYINIGRRILINYDDLQLLLVNKPA